MRRLPKSVGGRRRTGGAEGSREEKAKVTERNVSQLWRRREALIALSSQRSPHANDEFYTTYPDPLPAGLSNFKPLATDTRKKKKHLLK